MTSKIEGKISLSISGESHGEFLEGIISGLPKGEAINADYIALQMSRRAPGQDNTTTPRKEADLVEITEGVLDGFTTGEDIKIIIRNSNQHSSDYEKIKNTPRPSHADYPAFVKFGGQADMRGGGHYSGRLTAVLTALGAICRQILERRGITIGGHIYNIGESFDNTLDSVNITKETLENLSNRYFSTISEEAKEDMVNTILDAKSDEDSIGGTVEVAVLGMPVGIGNHMFGGVENMISRMVYAVPAVKGVAFGAGFDYSYLRGSEANDAFYVKDGEVKTATNNCGGILGGMTNGMPVIVKAALKPTPSINKVQNTVNLETMENVLLTVGGRHDPCIVARALPAVEAAVAIAVTMLLAEDNAL